MRAPFLDGLINLASRIGTMADKTVFGQYYTPPVNQAEINAAYRTSWFRKIVDIPPFDEVREWRTWTGADDGQITLIDKEEKRLGLRQKVAEARSRARKDGGALIILGTGRGDVMSQLKPETIGEGGLQYITVLGRDEVTPGSKIQDPLDPRYGEPQNYQLRGEGRTIQIHPSRVVRFIGNPIREQSSWDGWGDSVWMELRDAIRNSDNIAANISALVNEAKLDIIKLDGLMARISTQEYEDLLVKRWTALNSLKSSLNALIIDKNDDYEQKTLGFDGLPDIQDRALMIMSGMADIPATRLLGRSPQGMNATGDSDMRNYYDRIRSGQVLHLGPALNTLDECLLRSALGSRDEAIYYEWNPLYSLSEKEAADVEKVFADTAKVYADSALIPDTALTKIVRDGIIERGQMPGAQQAFDDAEAEGEIAGLLEEPTAAELTQEQASIATAMATVADPNGQKQLGAPKKGQFGDAAPRTLYVRRDVVNASAIRKWATEQGFTEIVPDLHVTIAYSMTEVDWFKVGTSWSPRLEISAGGPRQMERLGPDGKYIALLITASELVWRHREIIEAGASWNWPDYQPHISIQIGGDVDLSKVTAYQGKIILGPEIFEEVRVDEPGGDDDE
jgi:uncharacterized protein